MLERYKEHIDIIVEKISNFQDRTGNDKVIYSAVFGDVDDSSHLNLINLDGWDKILFYSGIQIAQHPSILYVHINFLHRDPRRTNRLFKILPHLFFSQYKFSLYFDLNIQVKNNINILLRSIVNSNYNLVLFTHNKRNCLYEEAKYIKLLSKDDSSIVNSQLNQYKSLNFPRNMGLFRGGILIRKHNDLVDFSERWWNEYESWSSRDQLSLAYLINSSDERSLNILVRQDWDVYFLTKEHKNYLFYHKTTFLQFLIKEAILLFVTLKKYFNKFL